MSVKKINKEWSLITAVSLGGILEWYEIGLYIYWPLIVLGNVFDYEVPAAEAINALLVIATGFIARPLGGILFGRWGDRKGRKTPFSWSIILVSLPSVCIAFLPSYVVWSYLATFFFTAMKFIQGVPAGGELPGAICYLSESGHPARRRYLCSYTFVGPQVGLLFSMAICLLLNFTIEKESLISFGWRIIFLSSGLIGILGFYLRRKLYESFEYDALERSFRVQKHPIHELFVRSPRKVILGFFISVFQVVSFCVLTIVPSQFYGDIFALKKFQILAINSGTLLLCAIIPPLIGKFGERFDVAFLFKVSAWGVIIFSCPFYLSLGEGRLLYTLCFELIFIFLYGIQAALIPSLISNIFPTSLRYTGIGCTFNVADGVLWGLIPILSSSLVEVTNNRGIFVVFLPVAAFIFLITFSFLRSREV